jgi:hypothetical protein
MLAFTGVVHAHDIYNVDPLVAKYARVVDAALSRSGGSIELPASDGIAGRLDYPSNDACPGASVHVAALGPAGVRRSNLDTVFVRGWKPIYLLTVSINRGKCDRDRITFKGFPKLHVHDSPAAKTMIYYMDLAVESGNNTHIPVGPPDERDASDVVFSFSTLPPWAANASGVSIPTAPTYRLIIGRQ